jgi:hypothetical protein
MFEVNNFVRVRGRYRARRSMSHEFYTGTVVQTTKNGRIRVRFADGEVLDYAPRCLEEVYY